MGFVEDRAEPMMKDIRANICHNSDPDVLAIGDSPSSWGSEATVLVIASSCHVRAEGFQAIAALGKMSRPRH
jgi:hypothetical protein